MNCNNHRPILLLSILAAALCGALPLAHAEPLGTAFTYQGRLVTVLGPASGTYELTFNLYDTGSGSLPIAPAVGPSLFTVTGGVFTATLDFGPVFQGDLRYLEITARTNDFWRTQGEADQDFLQTGSIALEWQTERKMYWYPSPTTPN